LPHRILHCGNDVVALGPGSVQDLRQQSTLSGSDGTTVHEDIELALPPLLELDGQSQAIVNQRSETRCLARRGGSGVAIDDADAHRRKYSSAHESNTAARMPRAVR
jgi:hypothetical protein